jgi:surfeit locus 1 family protein
MRGISFAGYRFRPGIFMTALAVAFVASMISLGNWQSRRAAEKTQLQERIETMSAGPAMEVPAAPMPPGDWAQRRLVARGEFLPGHLILLDNRVRQGVPGYHVVMPLRIGGSQMHVLVNRGWIAAGPRRDRLPEIITPPGVQEVEGIAVLPNARPYELAPDDASAREGAVRQNLVVDRISAQTRLALQPVVIQQTSPAADRLVREWPRADARADTNRAYALQWYAMALVGVVLWLCLNLKKKEAEQ